MKFAKGDLYFQCIERTRRKYITFSITCRRTAGGGSGVCCWCGSADGGCKHGDFAGASLLRGLVAAALLRGCDVAPRRVGAPACRASPGRGGCCRHGGDAGPWFPWGRRHASRSPRGIGCVSCNKLNISVHGLVRKEQI